MSRWALAAVVVFLTACTPLPDSYSIPTQRTGREGPEPDPLPAMADFTDPRSLQHIVDGFLPAASDQTWRWASASPTVRVRVSDNHRLRLRASFTFPDESHRSLLPITVQFFVNDHKLDSVAYKQTGIIEFRKPVPADWILPDEETLIRCEISPMYVAKADKVKLSMIITQIGLERDE